VISKEEHQRMTRELMLERHSNPKYDDLYSGKEHLDEAYNQMMDHDRDLNAQLESQTHKLYAKYRKFHENAPKRKKKRDRMLKSVLQKASFENHFMGNVLPKKFRDKPEVSLEHDGIRVSDKSNEIKQQKLMGMKNLDDLKHLDIGKQIGKRERLLRERNQEYFQEDKFKHPQERQLMETKVKMVKSVHGVRNQSFLLRNTENGESRTSFKPERGLRQVRRHRHFRNRKLKAKKPAKKSTKKKSSKKKKALKKKFKKIYKFDWKTLTWKHKKKYKYGLITSMKDLKFWKSMGIKIKKHKVSLFYRWESNRKHKKGQDNCVLTARFSPFTYFWDVQWNYVKATFKSNCENYTVEKLFKSYHNHGRSLIIYIGSLRFVVKYHHQGYRHGWYNRQYLNMKVFPSYKGKTFNPWKKPSDYVKFGILPSAALKWKRKQFKWFLKYRHHYRTKTEKEGKAAHQKDLIAKWKKRNPGKRYTPPRRLKQVDTAKPETKEKKVEIKTPKDRNLRQVARKLRRYHHRRIHWIHRWQNMWLYGYRDTHTSPEIIIAKNSFNPLVSRSIIKRLWTSTKTSIVCHGHAHRKTCRI
jgi:hypothetical protein